MSQAPDPSIQRHAVEIGRNRDAWGRRPALREAYRRLHALIASRLPPGVPGPVAELGSGIGALRATIPSLITTDMFANPGIDRVEDAYALGFADGSLSALILFDVWHHLRHPAAALREFHRVLAPGGRVILMEPAASWLGRVAYGLFHPEPLGLGGPLAWEAPPGGAARSDYFAAQAAATRAFWNGEASGRLQGWRLAEVKPVVAFDYLASGGFTGRRLAGPRLASLLRRANAAGALLPRVFAARLLVVLEREAGP